ncbi:MAG: transcription antitermination factor NusB [Candidatus Rifleibacteriota bacterium]
MALKTLYQSEITGEDLSETLKLVLAEVLVLPVIEPIAREFIKTSDFQEILSGEVEEFIPDFSESISISFLNGKNDLNAKIQESLEKHFSGLTSNSLANSAINKLEDKILRKLKKTRPVLKFSSEIISATSENKKKIDKILEETAKNWSLGRMGAIDRCILRSAACELLFFPDIPVNASINEAIELAKKYSAERSYEFVNGILDRIRKEHILDKNVPPKQKKADKNKKIDDKQTEIV